MQRTHDMAFGYSFDDTYKRMRFDNNGGEAKLVLPPISELMNSIPQPHSYVSTAPRYPAHAAPQIPTSPYLSDNPFPRSAQTAPHGMVRNIITNQSPLAQSQYDVIAASPKSYSTMVKHIQEDVHTLSPKRSTPYARSPVAKKPAAKAEATKKVVVTEDSSSSESESDDQTQTTAVVIPTVENPKFDFHQLQPIRILAYQIGLSKDPNKSWRYRDIKRALIDKSSKDQMSLLDEQTDHALLRQRLPHKLTLAQFCKRLMLLVFHFILRDGREPKFWRKKTVKHDLVKKILRQCEPEFYKRVNLRVALQLHSYIAAGMTVHDSLRKVEEEGGFKLE